MFIAIIPSKGKSNRLLNKNMRPLDGKPMIWYTINYIKSSKLIHDFFVSTEDKNIIKYCNDLKVKTIKRSEDLCGETPIIEVYKDAFKKLHHLDIKFLIGLQPDHPDRNLKLDQIINLMLEKKYDYLTSVEDDGTKNGAFFVLSNNILLGNDPKNQGFVIDNCTNIHTVEDLNKAEKRIKSFKKH